MNILVLNCGSSSLKFQVLQTSPEQMQSNSELRLAKGLVERIGGQALVTVEDQTGRKQKSAAPLRDHRSAIDHVLRWLVSDDAQLSSLESMQHIHAVGHRVVHGGERFHQHTQIDQAVREGIEDCIELAPLHNPANLKGIAAATELLGTAIAQVAVFDTAFHATMPESSYIYAIPYQLYRRHQIRRYGFHGTSYQYLVQRYGQITDTASEQRNVICLHLGNGCSACAVRGGQSFATSMGFTPLPGLVMGTRSGDVDPSLIEFLMVKEGMSVQEVDTLLNKHSGLLGVSGLTSDMRELLQEETDHQDRRVTLAIDIFCRQVRHYIGGYFAEMGGADAIIFSGGIGENSAAIRRRICQGLQCLGLILDEQQNDALSPGQEGLISTADAALAAYVIPTNEELLIARETVRVLS